ncbi:hypothetical protein CBR_g78792 [Chara braunii]|uniref:Thioredoxin domain-containing protein n=1 Tax=Chara braunii TaxID=69332 RepID=A0A388KAB0_CHABU|nr:hypothetical protein CBR_g78792 [Chara braunii]|eukprot:GBG67014.1 hypothetical protein CBR_g78792 [Chara braunii]
MSSTWHAGIEYFSSAVHRPRTKISCPCREQTKGRRRLSSICESSLSLELAPSYISRAWAGYCTAVHPLIRKLKTDFVGKPVNFIWAKSDNNPMLKSYGGKSQPHFLLYRNGNLMETVVGANVPLLAKLIPKLCPETLAEDKPEDNPMIKKRKEDLEAAAKKPDSAGKDSAT